MGMSEKAHGLHQLRQLKKARRGSAEDYYDLGVAYSMGQGDIKIDLIQAHKWFNLAAMAGMRQAQEDRAFVAADMTSAQIAEAQRLARDWLGQGQMKRAA
jgi:TPR repeat protein